jgi:hypothetical protein
LEFSGPQCKSDNNSELPYHTNTAQEVCKLIQDSLVGRDIYQTATKVSTLSPISISPHFLTPNPKLAKLSSTEFT